MSQEGQSAASAKPVLTNKQLAAKLEGIKDALRYADIESLEAGLTKIISILEASTPPDAERTALKELEDYTMKVVKECKVDKRLLDAVTFKEGAEKIYQIAIETACDLIRFKIDELSNKDKQEIDAQKRTGTIA